MHLTQRAEDTRLPVRPLTRTELVTVDVVTARLLAAVYPSTPAGSGAPPGPAAGRPARRGTTQGFGLAGMRGRVEMHDGELSAGPLAAGGFAVQAKIPYATAGGPR